MAVKPTKSEIMINDTSKQCVRSVWDAIYGMMRDQNVGKLNTTRPIAFPSVVWDQLTWHQIISLIIYICNHIHCIC